ncbi:zinc finger and SCAN domain-containing protein 2-like isoform X2 [Bicyclus anynana]|uniref:Zinc finger and SCAN domain-containing protein 2-like isoform X2 n=1 Tax=Bicyclus anynana TaxID=110368 RepID=A0ABM3M147_BICAN|nr:zinc finger and SCAN domain-containing protein 2-like isoform X2 [Bicyclus anynana]
MDWQLTCRVCLETGDMVSLFDWDENNEQLGDKYTYCCGVEVSKNDSLPTLICLNCVDRLTYACQFKKQCLSSNDTLKECLEEFWSTSQAVSGTKTEDPNETETITIKQENGLLLQYELPVEHDPQAKWTRTITKTPSSTVVTKSPGQRKRGRPRKYPNEQGKIDVSPYQRKKPKQEIKEPEALTTLLASGSLELKQEPEDTDELFADLDGGAADDPDFTPGMEDPESDVEVKKQAQPPKKRGRPRKSVQEGLKPKEENDGEDMLLKETIMAFSEPIPDHILNPKAKKRKPQQKNKKKYVYEKTHVCETCGASFTSNASLQAHIRRHLGIKPFVCSVCGYSCVMKEALKRHMVKHTGEKPYKCRICERRFTDYGTRQKHERLHMGLRPYQCALCGKSFTYSYVLANHMLTHTGEKKYSCAPCNKKFTKAHHLKYHNKVHHKDVYIQQQIEQEAKKIRQQLNVSSLTGVVTGQIVDGQLRLIQATSEDGDQEAQMQVVEELEEEEDTEEKETDRAVANMQGVVLDDDYSIMVDSK